MNIFSIVSLISVVMLTASNVNAEVPSYEVSVNDYNVYKNAYSHVKLNISNFRGGAPAYIEVPDFISNEPQIQKLFEVKQEGIKGNYVFDVFFPLPTNVTSLYLKIYPLGTDPTKLTVDTPGYIYLLDLSRKKDGSALMLYQENKEKNVRVYSASDVRLKKPSFKYYWYGTTLPEATAKINKAVIHLTEEQGSRVIDTTSFSIGNETLPVYNDPSNGNKKHIYFFTGASGKVTLTVRPSAVVKSGRLIYWPFADTSSEAMRMVVYDDEKFGRGLQVPIPNKNPTSLKCCLKDQLVKFKILNFNKRINYGGYIYVLVNGKYKKTIPSTNEDIIEFDVTDDGINSSKTEYPESNNIQYIYTNNHGSVETSRKRAFFVFEVK
ncbi:TPA: hypothetical protein ACS74J_003835 [Providencia alcalifaciens]